MMEDIRQRISEMISHGKEEPGLEDGEDARDSGSRSPAPTVTTMDVPLIRVESESRIGSRTGSPYPSGSQDSATASHTHLNPTAPTFNPGSSAASPSVSPTGGNKAMHLSSLAPHHSLLRQPSMTMTNPAVSSPLARGSDPTDEDEGPEDGEEEPEDGEDVGDVEMGEVQQLVPAASVSRSPSRPIGGSFGQTLSAPPALKKKESRTHVPKEDLEEGEASDSDVSSELSSLPDD